MDVGTAYTAIGDIYHSFTAGRGRGGHLHQFDFAFAGYQSYLHGRFSNLFNPWVEYLKLSRRFSMLDIEIFSDVICPKDFNNCPKS